MYARHSRIERSDFDRGFRHRNSTLHAIRCHCLNKTGREYNTTRACQCQRLPLESKLERERGISRGYADRLIVLLQYHALLLQKTMGWPRGTNEGRAFAHIYFG